MAAFDAGTMTSDGGGLLLRHTDRALGLLGRAAVCFQDHREQDQVVPTLAALLGQRIVGLALGYEDLLDRDHLRHDPARALLADRLAPKRSDCAWPQTHRRGREGSAKVPRIRSGRASCRLTSR